MKPHPVIAFAVTLLYLSPCWADQEAITNYAETRREHFYALYLDASAHDRMETSGACDFKRRNHGCLPEGVASHS